VIVLGLVNKIMVRQLHLDIMPLGFAVEWEESGAIGEERVRLGVSAGWRANQATHRDRLHF
jgi:hypothetical protein